MPKTKIIPYSTQWIDDDDISAVVATLSSEWVTQGPKIGEFEERISSYCGAKYAVVVSSGTAALHITCLAAGISKGDEVITSPMTFVASANCVLYCQADAVFADISEDTGNINPKEIEKVITKRTKAIIPVDFAGHPCDLDEIQRIAQRHKLLIIEDAAHALGARYKKSKVGSCKYSDAAVLSFHPVKAITTGEGGAILTNDKRLYERLRLFRNHGITKDKGKLSRYEGPWYYQMQELGFNYRITDLQCALGISQLDKLDFFIKRRREIAKRYNDAFKNMEWLTLPVEKKEAYSAFHLYVLKTDFDKIKRSKEEVVKFLRSKGIATQVHYIPVHMHVYYKKRFKSKRQNYPITERFYKSALSIPLFPKMSDKDIDYVIQNIKNLSK